MRRRKKKGKEPASTSLKDLVSTPWCRRSSLQPANNHDWTSTAALFTCSSLTMLHSLHCCLSWEEIIARLFDHSRRRLDNYLAKLAAADAKILRYKTHRANSPVWSAEERGVITTASGRSTKPSPTTMTGWSILRTFQWATIFHATAQ